MAGELHTDGHRGCHTLEVLVKCIGAAIFCLLVSGAGRAGSQVKVEYDVERRVAQEAFETEGTRAGQPELIREDVAPAVFVKTGKGVYTVASDKAFDGVAALLPGPYEMRLPEGGDEWLQVGFVLHRFAGAGAKEPAACSARFFIGPADAVKAGQTEPYSLMPCLSLLVTYAPKTKDVC